MKIKTPFFILEIEIMFIIIILVSILSSIFRNYISSYFVCYLFILFHELSHMFVASLFGKEIEIFKFSVSGVNIKFKYNNIKIYKIKVLQEILIYMSGPISNLLLAIIFINNNMILQINLFLAFINLLPIYPLDGYNILKNILYMCLNFKKSSIILNIINKILFIILALISFFQIIFLKNPSILIFLIYIYIINQSNKKDIKYAQILSSNIC